MAARLTRRIGAGLLGAGVSAIAARAAGCDGTTRRRDPLAPDDVTKATLDTLYADLPTGDEIPIDDLRAIDDSGGHEAYGELTIRGMRELRPRLAPGRDDVFYDLGSGVGRSVMQAAMERPVARAIGVELSATRDDVGQRALSRVQDAALRERSAPQ